MLSPDNQVPPFATIAIGEDSEGLQSEPFLDAFSNQSELVKERVTITTYGTNNRTAQDMLYALLQYSYDTELFGVLNIPTIRDVREGQNELNILAQKKRMEFEISYNQSAARGIARQLIERCLVTVTPQEI